MLLMHASHAMFHIYISRCYISLSASRVKRSLAFTRSQDPDDIYPDFMASHWLAKRLRPVGVANVEGPSHGGVIPMARIGKRFWGDTEDDTENDDLEKEIMIPTARIGRAGTMIPMARIGKRQENQQRYQIPMPRIG